MPYNLRQTAARRDFAARHRPSVRRIVVPQRGEWQVTFPDPQGCEYKNTVGNYVKLMPFENRVFHSYSFEDEITLSSGENLIWIRPDNTSTIFKCVGVDGECLFGYVDENRYVSRLRWSNGWKKFQLDENGNVEVVFDDSEEESSHDDDSSSDDDGYESCEDAIVGSDHEEENEHMQCVACTTNKRVVAYGCGHVCYCIGCHNASKSDSCPICKARVKIAIRLFDY